MPSPHPSPVIKYPSSPMSSSSSITESLRDIMRMSCNGCRVLRKGCGDDCIIRPCLQWITSPDFQANATLFLAKFYGRAGLINLINAAPPNSRPAIFKSLLYEACGRIVNPISGSVGLLWSGNWGQCQGAVEAVLKGTPIKPVSVSDDGANSDPNPTFKPYDIRHNQNDNSVVSKDLHNVMSRAKFKRSLTNNKPWVNRDDLNWVGDPKFRSETETETEDTEIKLELALG